MEFDFSVVDGATGAFKAMESALGKFEEELKHVDSELYKLERHDKMLEANAIKDPMKQKAAYMRIYRDDLRQATKAHEEAKEPAQGFFEALIEADVLQKAAEMAKELAEKVIDLGEEFFKTGLEMADFRNDALLSIGAITGADESAGEFLETLEFMSKGTKDTGEQMFASFQRMGAFTKQFGKKATEDVLAGIADVNVAFGKSAADSVLSAIQNSQAMGKFDERSLRGLKESGVATPERLMAVLAERNHTSIKRIDAMLKAGKISAAEGTTAILGLIRADLDKGGAVGSLSKKSADQDFGTQIKNLKDHAKELFEKVNTKPLVDAVAKLGALFDPATERGKKLEGLINRMFKGVGDVVSWVTEGDRLSKIFDEIGAAAEVAWPIIKGLGIMIGVLGVGVVIATAPIWLMSAAFYAVVGAGLYVIGSLGKVWDKLKLWGKEAADIGKNFVDGLVDGIKSTWAHLISTVIDLAHALPAAVRKALGIKSPSRVMFEIGSYTAEGMQKGLQAKVPEVRASMTDVMLPTPKFSGLRGAEASLSAPALAVPPTRGGSRSYTGGDIYVDLHVSGAHDGAGSDHEQLAELVAKHVREEVQPVVRAEIVRFMEDDSIAN